MKKRFLICALCLCTVVSSVFVAAPHVSAKRSCDVSAQSGEFIENTSATVRRMLGFDRKIKLNMIDPELRPIALLLRLMPTFGDTLFRVSNIILDNFGKGVDLTKDVNFKQIFIDRADGTKLRLCVYTPEKKQENVPGLLWIHGGGYALGIPEQDHQFIGDFVRSSGCVVVAPDYTNSTDAPYPAALNDCYAALCWLKENGGQYGMRSDQLFVGGDSAGGGLTAAISLYARDRGDVSIAFQMPLYPMLDDRMITESSQNNDAPIWSSKSNEAAWKLYLGDSYGTDNVSKYAAPSRETNYSNLPPTLTYVGTVEPFTDETVKYVNDLRDAGVDVSFRLYEGCFHAFDMFGYASVAKDAKAFLLDGFMYAVEHHTKAQP